MSFLTLMLKNPFRNKTRTALAIIGIAIGIATIVALGMITNGLQTSTQSTLTAGAAEITVTQTGTNAFEGGSGGILNESLAGDLQNISGVKQTAGILRATSNITVSSGIIPGGGLPINGIDSNQLSLEGIDSVNGSFYSNGTSQIILGKTVAQSLNKTIGSTINLFGTNFTVTGIYQTGEILIDSGGFTSLNTLQNLTSNQGKISEIAVKINDNANATTVSQTIQNAYPNQLTTATATEQANTTNQALSTISTADAAISLLAIVIGGIGIINVMIMSVFERTREFGVLKAVGWRSTRILTMVLGESIILTITAAVVGVITGYVGANLLLNILSTGGLSAIHPTLTADVLLRAFAIALIVGILGGLYPAYRASRLPPTEALHYE